MTSNKLQIKSNNQPPNKVYDLEERTFIFARDTAIFCNKLPKTPSNIEHSKQLIRASSSPGANYIEANESLGSKDFKLKIKTCRREAKEAAYWLRLIRATNGPEIQIEAVRLYNESIELKKIFSSIANK